MASVASARPISLRHKPSPSHAKSSQRPLCASFRSHPRRTITAPHRPRQASIPIAPAAPPAISFREFVPWRFSDAGRTHAPLDLQSGVRETCTKADMARAGPHRRDGPEAVRKGKAAEMHLRHQCFDKAWGQTRFRERSVGGRSIFLTCRAREHSAEPSENVAPHPTRSPRPTD